MLWLRWDGEEDAGGEEKARPGDLEGMADYARPVHSLEGSPVSTSQSSSLAWEAFLPSSCILRTREVLWGFLWILWK